LGVPLEPGSAVVLAVPSARTLISAICPGNGDNETSVLAGNIVDSDTGHGIGGASVLVTWVDVEASKEKGVEFTPRQYVGKTDHSGSYHVCGLPADFDARVTASHDGQTTGEIPILSDRPDVMLLNLTLGLSAASRGVRNAKVQGVVTTPDRRPLEGVNITVPGFAVKAVTDSRGRFELGDLPSGTRNLFVRRIGFVPLTLPVDLSSTNVAEVELILDNFVSVLDPVVVRARRDRALASVGFTDRRKRGLGDYRTRDEFEKLKPRYLSDILRTMRGVNISYSRGETVIASRRQSTNCIKVFVDRAHWPLVVPGDLDDMLFPNDVSAIEVYDGTTVPADFETGDARGCLTLVFWTRARTRDRSDPSRVEKTPPVKITTHTRVRPNR
jgi:hypothetical protein